MLSSTVFRVSLALAIVTPAFAGSPTLAPLDKTPVNIEQAATFAPLSASWNLSAGYQWKQLGSLNFNTGSQAAHSSLPWMAGRPGGASAPASSSSSFGDPNAAGSTSSIANRTYSDGYVNQDGGTAFFGDTWNWGYNNASQVQGNNLSFHNIYGNSTTTGTASSSSFSSSSSSLRHDLGWSSDLSGSGWFASLGSPAIFTRGPIAVSMELGYSYASAGAGQTTDGVFQAHQESGTRTTTGSSTTTTTTTATDIYDVTGLIVPSAPYQGTFTGPGPLISNTPASRNLASSSAVSTTPGRTSTSISTADFVSNVNESLHMKLNTISIGPHLSWETGRLALGVSTGFALNVADWDSSYQENLNVRQNGGAYRLLKRYQYESNGVDVLPGAYLELNANLRLTRHVALFVGGRYDWAGSLHGDVGPSTFDFKVRGWSALGGVTVTF